MKRAAKTTRDPIFARIAEFKAACAAKHKAQFARHSLEAKLAGKTDYQAKAEERGLTKLFPPLYVGHAYAIQGSKHARTHALSRLQDAGTAFGPKMKRKLVALAPFASRELTTMLDSFRKEHERKRKAAGLTALHDAARAASKVCAKARRRMVVTAPRTPQGAAALATVLAGFDPDYDLDLGIKALARAVTLAAGRRKR